VVVAWLLFPLVLLAVCGGCGLAVERISGWRLPGSLLPSVGLALVVAAAALTTSREITAPFTTPLVVLLALAGYATSWARLRTLRIDRWALSVGLGLFAVCAAPVVLSGSAGFLGYFVLNDAAVHFALINQLLAHGHDFATVPPSTLLNILRNYISTSYPTGADVALGAVRPLVGQNVAWLFAPYLAVVMAFNAVALYEVLDRVVSSRALRAACAFVAAQAGLVYAYYLEGSIKELATAWIITVTVALVASTLRQRIGLRGLIPLLITAVAGLDILELAIVPWLAPPLAVFAFVAGWRARHSIRTMGLRRIAVSAAAVAVFLIVLLEPIISTASTFFTVATGVLTEANDLGNLAAPLPRWEMLGIWPADDFRLAVSQHYDLAYALIGVALASAVLATVWMLRRRLFAPLLLLAGNGVATLYLLSRSSPYASAKVMMIFSVTAVLVAMLGAAALHDAGRRVEGWMLALAIGGGVLWTNALGYHNASVAPRARFNELAAIGSRFAGQGPTFYNLSDEFAIDFLPKEAVADPALGTPQPRAGFAPTEGRMPWDPDNLALSYLEAFRLLVLGRSPLSSRPPANYRLAYEGRYYDVWQRTATPQILAHIPLGGPFDPVAVPPCRLVTATAARAAREHARLAYVARASVPTLVPSQAVHPSSWFVVTGVPFSPLATEQPGALIGSVRVPESGRYQVWLEGSFSARIQISVGGHRVGSVSYELGPPGQSVQIGQVTLGAGAQRVVISRPGNGLTPGGVGMLGPLMLVRDGPPSGVSEIAPAQAKSLCGQSLDWLEIVR